MKVFSLPDFSLENYYWKNGLRFIGGADEVGRGAFAGPVVASVVVFPPYIKPEVEINDSKKLSIKKRVEADVWIRQNASFFAISSSSVFFINKYGIVPATHRAFASACSKLNCKLEHLLIDGREMVEKIKVSQTPIIKGDGQSLSIAAASILAKVYRDNLMHNLATKINYQMYGWESNVGYGTQYHREAIKKHGTCKLHRNIFVRNYLAV